MQFLPADVLLTLARDQLSAGAEVRTLICPYCHSLVWDAYDPSFPKGLETHECQNCHRRTVNPVPNNPFYANPLAAWNPRVADGKLCFPVD